jgi:hypothetical protein
VVGFLASMFAVFIGFVTHHSIDWGHALLLCGAASATTAIASSALGWSLHVHYVLRFTVMVHVRCSTENATVSFDSIN